MIINFKGFIFAIISAIGFALMGICGITAYKHGISTYNLLTWRFAISFILLALALPLLKAKLHNKSPKILPALLLGAIGYAGLAFLYFTTIKYLPTGITTSILYTYPSLVAVLTMIIDKKMPTPIIWLAIFLSILGIILITDLKGNVSSIGLLLGIYLAFWYAIYIKVSEKLLNSQDVIIVSLLLFLGATITFFGLAILDNSFFIPKNSNQWLPIIALSFFSTLIAISFFFLAIKHIGSVKASIISTLEPVITIFIGILFLEEEIILSQIVGVIFILIAVLLNLKKHNSK